MVTTFLSQIVRESPRIRLVKQKDVHAYRSIIIIKGAKKEDEGLYEITVKNREGEAKNHITLRVTVRLHDIFLCETIQLSIWMVNVLNSDTKGSVHTVKFGTFHILLNLL